MYNILIKLVRIFLDNSIIIIETTIIQYIIKNVYSKFCFE